MNNFAKKCIKMLDKIKNMEYYKSRNGKRSV